MSDPIRNAVGGVLRNASNFPEKVQRHLLGQDMGPLIEKVTGAVKDAPAEQPEPEWEYGQGIVWDDDGLLYVGESFDSDHSRALDEGYVLVRRVRGPWQVVGSARLGSLDGELQGAVEHSGGSADGDPSDALVDGLADEVVAV